MGENVGKLETTVGFAGKNKEPEALIGQAVRRRSMSDSHHPSSSRDCTPTDCTKIEKREAQDQIELSKEQKSQESCKQESRCDSTIVKDKQRASSLSGLDLPEVIVHSYRALGIDELYEWQVSCLSAVLKNPEASTTNLVYTAPTSSGKSLVAEILMLKNVIGTSKKAFYILPFISIVDEKVDFLSKLCSSLQLRVEGFYANQMMEGFAELSIAICTFEKANSMLNRMIEDGSLKSVVTIVVDELHMIGEPSRGCLLELLLTKIQFFAPHIQIIGMSATLPNIAEFGKWLSAHTFTTSFRPVPLKELIKIGNSLYNSDFIQEKSLASVKAVDQDASKLVYLCSQTVGKGQSVLVFCPSRKDCEKTAAVISSVLPKYLPQYGTHKLQDRKELLKQLKKAPTGLDETLSKTVQVGVAYHHAGMTLEERSLIEQGYRKGTVSVMTATSTVAAGVNLPARRVIFKCANMGPSFLDCYSYRQMCGRAGRKGIDTYGESILCLQASELTKAKETIFKELLPIKSSFGLDAKGMARSLLEAFVDGIVNSVTDIDSFIKCTLMSAQEEYKAVHSITKEALTYLQKHEFIEWHPETSVFEPTLLGIATVYSSLSPSDGVDTVSELAEARKQLILDSDLHLVYLITPLHQLIYPNWQILFRRYNCLSPNDRRVADRIGVSEAFLVKMNRTVCRSALKVSNSKEERLFKIHQRFYNALLVSNLMEEIPLRKLAEKHEISRGQLQSLQSSSCTFAGIITVFCQQLGWWDLELLFGRLGHRLNHRVQHDLVPLMSIPHMTAKRARILHDAGFKTVQSIAASEAKLLCPHIRSETPFEQKLGKSSTSIARAQAMRGREIKIAEQLVASAKKFVQLQAVELMTSTESIAGESGLVAASQHARLLEAKCQFSSQTVVKRASSIKGGASQVAKYSVSEQSGMENCRKAQNSSPLKEYVQAQTEKKKFVFVSTTSVYNLLLKQLHHQKVMALQIAVTKNSSVSGRSSLPIFSVLGVAFSFDPDTVFYLRNCNACADGKACTVSCGWGSFLTFLKYQEISSSPKMLVIANFLGVYCKLLRSGKSGKMLCQWIQKMNYADPVIADWMVNPDNDSYLVPKKSTRGTAKNTGTRPLASIYVRLVSDPWRELRELINSAVPTVQESEVKCCEFATNSLYIMNYLWQKLRKDSLLKTFETVEMPMSRLLAVLQFSGFGFDPSYFSQILPAVTKRLQHLEEEASKLLSKRILLTSPAQVKKVLFEDLKLPYPDGISDISEERESVQKDGTGTDDVPPIEIPSVGSRKRKAVQKQHFSTSAEVLEALCHLHRFPNLVLEHRRLSTLMSKYLTVLPPLAISCKGAYRLFPQYYQISTPTGRVVVDNPNLQSIPRDQIFLSKNSDSDADADNQALKQADGVMRLCLRNAFVAKPGHVLLSADYAQIELRILAHFSSDKNLLAIFNQAGGRDIFSELAATWLKKSSQTVTGEERGQAKAICYGIIYGMGQKLLSNKLGVSVEQAAEHQASFHARFPGISKYITKEVSLARERRYVTTLFGRRRYLVDIRSGNFTKKSAAERKVINTICQGSAADIIKLAMLDIDKALCEKYPENSNLTSTVSCVLQLHDEVIFEIPEKLLSSVAEIITQKMQSVYKLSIPLTVRLKAGPSWGQMSWM